MRRLITLLAAAILAALPLGAVQTGAESAPEKTGTRSYEQLAPFEALDVSWVYQVELQRSDRCSVSVTAPQSILQYLKVGVSNGKLTLSVENLSRDIQRQVEVLLRHSEVKAVVSMPTLSGIEIHGAAKLSATGSFSTPKDRFSLKMSGATAISGLAVQARSADIQGSGAAKFDLLGDFRELKLTLSGAVSGSLASGQLSEPVQDAVLRLSGAVKFTLSSRIEELNLESSGAVSFSMTGSAGKLSARGSGASSFELIEAPAEQARISLSGAAKASLAVNRTLDVKLGGAATCRYKAGAACRITIQEVSRGASLKRL